MWLDLKQEELKMRKIMKAVGIELSKTESENLKTTAELLKKMQMELSTSHSWIPQLIVQNSLHASHNSKKL